MKKQAAKSLRVFAIELAVYAVLVICYFFLVLHLLGEWLYRLETQHRYTYAVVAILLIAGAECGAQLIQVLKRAGNVNLVVSYVAIVVYFGIAVFMLWESRKTLRSGGGRSQRGLVKGAESKKDRSAFSPVTRNIQRLKIWPMITLPTSGIRISLWTILLVAFVGGVFSGFLGGGAGYIRMPSMVYVLGIPTHLAVGTDLFEIVISASYVTNTHAIKGNVDI